ncbi:hypothetical protein RHMOL_Rhmol02G0171500 [Rhododendron molle]|uniref:Uncharacterized protein n=1 Tax=Rhododendron molle TaxID=49168 RepID=A0ACC0PTJ8_RHOML|nr:hypothetical protein RHMOL_Rhmol02G0171500 [Rhododendron molle]
MPTYGYPNHVAQEPTWSGIERLGLTLAQRRETRGAKRSSAGTDRRRLSTWQRRTEWRDSSSVLVRDPWGSTPPLFVHNIRRGGLKQNHFSLSLTLAFAPALQLFLPPKSAVIPPSAVIRHHSFQTRIGRIMPTYGYPNDVAQEPTWSGIEWLGLTLAQRRETRGAKRSSAGTDRRRLSTWQRRTEWHDSSLVPVRDPWGSTPPLFVHNIRRGGLKQNHFSLSLTLAFAPALQLFLPPKSAVIPPSAVIRHHSFQVFSMVDPGINSPNVDPDAYPDLMETIQSLGRGYRSFDERSSNFPRPIGLRPRRPKRSTEQAAAGAQASTSTSSGGVLNTSGEGGANAPPRDIDIIPPLPTGLGPMPYNNFYGDGPGVFTEEFRMKYSIPDDVLVERVTTNRIPFGEEFIVLPLFAIIEGGGGG